jgi:hypothetical protein
MFKSLICLLFGHDINFTVKLNTDPDNQNASEILLTQPAKCKRCSKVLEVCVKVKKVE